jgi:NAD(P)-dependent dehydrogenase (short-subunit alcohol dehydrogenase family)
LDQNNSALLGGSPLSSSSSIIYQEELSSSTANIRLIKPEHALKSVSEAESKRRHHGKTDTPLYRLAAVIVNPQSSAVGSIEKVDLDLWRQAVDANITGAVIAAQKFMPLVSSKNNNNNNPPHPNRTQPDPTQLLTNSFLLCFPAFYNVTQTSSSYAFLSCYLAFR